MLQGSDELADLCVELLLQTGGEGTKGEPRVALGRRRNEQSAAVGAHILGDESKGRCKRNKKKNTHGSVKRAAGTPEKKRRVSPEDGEEQRRRDQPTNQP